MRGLVPGSLLLGVLALAAPARAGIHPRIVDQPRGIALVGHHGAPDPAGTVTFTVVDRFFGVPLTNLAVRLDLGNCPDVRVDSEVVAGGVTVNCLYRSAYALTDAEGKARLTIVGEASGTPSSLGPCAVVSVEGYVFDPMIVSAYDLDGVYGVNGMDLSLFAGDMMSGSYRARSDHDADGDVDAMDLGLWARVFVRGGSPSSGATPCAP